MSFEEIPAPQTLKSGWLQVGTSFTYAPMYFEQSDGRPTGFGYAISEAVAQLMDLRLLRIPCENRDAVFDQVRSGTVDLGATTYEVGDLPDGLVSCNSVIACDLAVVDHDGRSGLHGVDELRDFDGPILAQDRTVIRDWLDTEVGEGRYELENDPEKVLQAVREDRAAIGVVEQVVALYYLESLFTTLEVVDSVETGWSYGFITRSDDQTMLDAVNRAEGEMNEEGLVDSLESRWFGETL